ncbi:LytR family transcriptional regulator [Lactobacillus mulieris]|uniref:LCP family protein n=1 Tax=Lactobacillus TaxID=1578 RepID=UPI00019C7809|nr:MULTISPECIES: LCP family protein [Lactobacillus]EFH29323.1 cell envelope-like function transcriptional attenuator common domain protein [Lactobacillus jensenii JV-V16]KAA9245295.1 LytR family transcriptional regulator [Lactobacillus jensenii]MCW8124045.1 LCP family protein [Lactobacillus mulieris]MCZ9599318.1 LCP family protein [Lactobacillus mulieris]MDK7326933.1 LCP family protein [Lactobacillus mulieris]
MENNEVKHHHHHHHHRHHRKFWRGFWVVFGVVVLAGFIACGMIYKNLRDTANKMYTPVAKNTTSNKNRSLDSVLAAKKPINILLLGTDTGAMGRDWRGRTDTIMMLAINPNSNKTTIVSIPRDSNAIFPDYPEYGVTKINSAYTLGGVSETIKTLDKYYSVPIDGYIMINMGGLEKAIDQVGGVTVTSPLTFDNQGYSFEKGKTYHMKGKKALAFVQLRHGDPMQDYGRQVRNRLVVMALLKKSISPSTLVNTGFLKSISDEMQTDLTMNQMYKIGMDYRHATDNLTQDHAQGTSKMTNNPKFGQMEIEVISQEERQRVSDEIRSTLDLAKVQVKENKASYIMNN